MEDIKFIKLNNISYAYDLGTSSEELAIDGLNLDIEEGENIAILGKNGSGKSTLAKLLNALLLPQTGDVLFIGRSTKDDDVLENIHAEIGMVFQNPDNQIVGTTVEEDVAFGPENIAMPRELMLEVVPVAIESVGLKGMELKAPSNLSGGQKQKLAIAGILAMKPKVIILDEATSMLDPRSRDDLLTLIFKLNREHNITIINVTHNVDEIINHDRVILMDKGQIQFIGKPAELFTNDNIIKEFNLVKPAYIRVTEIIYSFVNQRVEPHIIISPELAAKNIHNELSKLSTLRINEILSNFYTSKDNINSSSNRYLSELDYLKKIKNNRKTLIEARNISFSYNLNDKKSVNAIKNISFSIYEGEFIGICGNTGSGKSTLVQHLNGILKLQSGELKVFGYDVSKKKQLADLRRYVGMVMQYPEDQLFAETIYDDIAFGPRKLGMDEDEIRKNIDITLNNLGLKDFDLQRSPFALSGGQMRRVALAGIMAMRPQVLILDEPAAGLDPQGREELYKILKKLQNQGTTIIMISHSMEDIAQLCDRVMILKSGELIEFTTVKDLFSNSDLISKSKLAVPKLLEFADMIAKYYNNLKLEAFTEQDLIISLLRYLSNN